MLVPHVVGMKLSGKKIQPFQNLCFIMEPYGEIIWCSMPLEEKIIKLILGQKRICFAVFMLQVICRDGKRPEKEIQTAAGGKNGGNSGRRCLFSRVSSWRFSFWLLASTRDVE